MPRKIFINYRRGDDPGSAGRLFDRLEQAFDSDELFMDVDNIEAGLDFVEVLDEQVAQCDVFLAVIGEDWLHSTDAAGQRRLDDPNDFVRIEIESALKRRKRVIPVLVNDAQMPPADNLPETLAPLARRQAVRLAHDSFRADSERLIRALKSALAKAADKREQQEAEAEAQRQAEEEQRRHETEEHQRAEAEARRQAEEEQQRREARRKQAEEQEQAERERQAARAKLDEAVEAPPRRAVDRSISTGKPMALDLGRRGGPGCSGSRRDYQYAERHRHQRPGTRGEDPSENGDRAGSDRDREPAVNLGAVGGYGGKSDRRAPRAVPRLRGVPGDGGDSGGQVRDGFTGGRGGAS